MTNVGHHGQFFVICFGRCAFEKQAIISNRHVSASTLNEQGEIDTLAHPWARQLSADRECLVSHIVGESLRELWRPPTIQQLWNDDMIREAFVLCDIRALRASFWMSQWSPLESNEIREALPFPAVLAETDSDEDLFDPSDVFFLGVASGSTQYDSW